MRLFMGVLALVIVSAMCIAVVTSHASGPPLPPLPVANVRLPGQSVRFDYMSVDPAQQALHRAHGRRARCSCSTCGGAARDPDDRGRGVHGVLAVPQLQRVFASATDDRALLTIVPDGARAQPCSVPASIRTESPTTRSSAASSCRTRAAGIEAVFDSHREADRDDRPRRRCRKCPVRLGLGPRPRRCSVALTSWP